MKLLWLTDLHLDQADPSTRLQFYQRLRSGDFDSVIVTGDISISHLLATHLGEIAQACAPKKVYFVLGNHDFYGSSFEAVDRIAAACCVKHSNLLHLGHGEIIPLGSSSALIGHRGWADGRAYTGKRTSCRFPDQDGIRDLRYRSTYPAFRKMEKLGRASGDYFRRVLPYAMTSYNHIVIATHFPPFACAARFDNRPCKAHELAHYVNASAGGVIQRIGEFFPKSRMTVLSGHTHHAATACISPNLEIRVGAARRGDPKITEIFEVQ